MKFKILYCAGCSFEVMAIPKGVGAIIDDDAVVLCYHCEMKRNAANKVIREYNPASGSLGWLKKHV